MESITYIASDKVDQTELQNFHEFRRGYTGIFAKNVILTEDHTYKELKTLIHNKDVVILKDDKDSSIVIMNKTDYITKIETMIEQGVKNGTYAETDDTAILKSMNITMKCILKVMNQRKCMARQKLKNLIVQITSN